MLPVLLALGASVSWGVADFLAGLKSRGLKLLVVLTTTQGVGLLTLAAVVAARGTPPPDGLELYGYGVLAGLFGLFALASFYRGLASGTMSIVAPISATGAAIPVAVGIASGEQVSALQAAGILAALAGVVLASRVPEHAVASPESHSLSPGGEDRGEGAHSDGLLSALPRPVLAPGAGWALLAALGFGAFFVALPYASGQDVLWALLVQRGTSAGVLAVVVLTSRQRLAARASDAPALVGIGLLDVLANLLYALAGTLGLLSLVAVLASLYPVVTIALARLLLGEHISAVQRAGVAAALSGVALISVR